PSDMPIWDKIVTIAQRIYGAADVVAPPRVRKQIDTWQNEGYGHYPVCIAKTQSSFSTDATRRGAPSGHTLDIREVRLSAGAGFIVIVCGEVMTMPGLPKAPAAMNIDVTPEGRITGLF
ncbi:MAG: formate--tetrahydrofolate ligase, partial [Lautropia sp.]|nr:formate--tetrahydrofolate ligase [Lautropia sp.]